MQHEIPLSEEERFNKTLHDAFITVDDSKTNKETDNNAPFKELSTNEFLRNTILKVD